MCNLRHLDARRGQWTRMLGGAIRALWHYGIDHWNGAIVDRNGRLDRISGRRSKRQDHRRPAAGTRWRRDAREPNRDLGRRIESLWNDRDSVCVFLLGLGIVSFQVTDDAEVDFAFGGDSDAVCWSRDADGLLRFGRTHEDGLASRFSQIILVAGLPDLFRSHPGLHMLWLAVS